MDFMSFVCSILREKKGREKLYAAMDKPELKLTIETAAHTCVLREAGSSDRVTALLQIVSLRHAIFGNCH